jgi:hypothetical protein
VRSLVADLRAQGYIDVAGSIVEGTGRAIRGGLRSPNIYLLLAAGGQQLVVDLGHTINDDSLTRIEKERAAAWAVAKVTGGIIGGTMLMAALKRVSPRAAEGSAIVMGLSLALNAGDIIRASYRAVTGRYSDIDAVRHWQAVGIPDAGFLHVDDRSSWWTWLGLYDHNDPTTDVYKFEDGIISAPRIKYWYTNLDSSFHQRMRQILPSRGANTPILDAAPIIPANVKAYTEPVYEAVHFLDALGSTPNLPAKLMSIDAVRTFKADEFHADMRRVAPGIYFPVKLNDGREIYDIDEQVLLRMLKRYDRYSDLNATQRATLDKRDAMAVRQAKLWAATVSGMSISDDAKRAALTQMVENYAGLYLWNSMMFRYYDGTNIFGLPNRDTNIDDYYMLGGDLVGLKPHSLDDDPRRH